LTKKIYAILAIALAALMISPVLADVFVPPGPSNPLFGSQSEWISPTLAVFESTAPAATAPTLTGAPIGWVYTNGPTYNTYTATGSLGNPMSIPYVYTSTGALTGSGSPSTAYIPYGQPVTVVGFIPGVSIAYNEVPPPVELQISWNNIPDIVTLSVPSTQVSGTSYPAEVYPNQVGSYTYCYPVTGANKAASYNLWCGNYATVLQTLWGTSTPPAWWTNVYGPASSAQNGEWFWYTFTPNAGDWIGYGETAGQASTPPTYDITAMFEYGTTQIWFNHVCFNDCLLQLYKSTVWSNNEIIDDQILVSDVGSSTTAYLPLSTVTSLDLTQTFPSYLSLTIWPLQAYSVVSIVSTSTGATIEPPIALPNVYNLEYPNDYVFSTSGLPSAYTTLAPGQTLVVSMELQVTDTAMGTSSDFKGTVVFDAQASAAQIAPFKYPLAIATLAYPMGVTGLTGDTNLWTGNVLTFNSPNTYGMGSTIGGVSTSVPGTVLRTYVTDTTPISDVALTESAPWALDPAPIPLIAGETSVTAADVALVQNMVLGLAPYNSNADLNANGYITLQDLAEYEAAAGMS